MGKVVTVDGLEMFGFYRPPGGAQCDRCGIKVQMRGRRYHRHDLPTVKELREQGWLIPREAVGEPAVCPDCHHSVNRIPNCS